MQQYEDGFYSARVTARRGDRAGEWKLELATSWTTDPAGDGPVPMMHATYDYKVLVNTEREELSRICKLHPLLADEIRTVRDALRASDVIEACTHKHRPMQPYEAVPPGRGVE